MVVAQNLWLHDMLLKSFLKNGFSKTNENKSWELTDLQYLHLSDSLAQGFLDFTKHPIYRKQFFELEVSLIHEQARMIAKTIGEEAFNLFDVYCGDGLKAVEFVKALNKYGDKPINIRYCPLNPSQLLIDTAVKNMQKAGLPNVVEYHPALSSGHGDSLRYLGRQLRTAEFSKHVVLLLGGVIACFEINEYLFELRRDLLRDDTVIIGNGVRVGERLVDINKYKDPVFHIWFKHLMFGLGFNEKDITFDARFGNSRVEFLYKLKTSAKKKVGEKTIEFKPGDEFVIAGLYKYYSEEFSKFCKMYFANSQVVTNKENEYALVVCKK